MENSFNMTGDRTIRSRVTGSNKGRKISSFDNLVRLERAVRIAEFARDAADKHGPVRIIVKDGQPVSQNKVA